MSDMLTSTVDGTTVVMPYGEIDLMTATPLMSLLDSLTYGPDPDLVVDLTEVLTGPMTAPGRPAPGARRPWDLRGGTTDRRRCATMGRGRQGRKRLWRWRSNPLRRRDDIAEAWVVLAVWVLVVVGGTTAGLVAAQATATTLDRQRTDRHSVHAVLLADVPRPASGKWSSGDKDLAKVRWRAPDGSARVDRTLVTIGLRAGTRVVVWEDGRGTLVTEPPSAAEATLEAAVLGGFAALALAGSVGAAGALVRRRLDQRRMAGWDREWDLVGPKWGHRTG